MRARIAARLVRPGSRVLDLGCGAMVLREHLPPGCTYIPADLVKRSEDTHLIELNKGLWPLVRADVTVALGLAEYLHDIDAFLAGTCRCAPELLFSYHVRTSGSEEARLSRLTQGWLSDLSLSSLIAASESAGAVIERVTALAPKRHFIQYFIKLRFTAAEVADAPAPSA